MVYVLNCKGVPIMPTTRHGMVRRLLKEHKAKVVKRCHNRQIHKFKTLKGGRRKLNQALYTVKGFRLFDKVKIDDKVGFIFGRMSTGYLDIKNLQGDLLYKAISCKKVKLLDTRKNWLIEKC